MEEKALIRRYTGMSGDDVAYAFIQARRAALAAAAALGEARGSGELPASMRPVHPPTHLPTLATHPSLDPLQEALKSCAHTAVIAMQDVMRLDDSARMNVPGRAAGNWAWRVGGPDVWRQLADEQATLRGMIRQYDRAPPGGLRAPASGAGLSGSASFRA